MITNFRKVVGTCNFKPILSKKVGRDKECKGMGDYKITTDQHPTKVKENKC